MSGMDGWEEEDSNASGDDDGGGFGLGVGMLLGGALAWIFGGGREEDFDFPDELLPDLSEEEELEEAVQEEDWEQVLLLMNVFNGCLENAWKPFVPGTKTFSPSPKYLTDIEGLIGPSLKMMEAAIELKPDSRIDPERILELDGRRLSVDLDEWKFTFE